METKCMEESMRILDESVAEIAKIKQKIRCD